MKFIEITSDNLEDYKVLISQFFERNIESYNFFHPHKFSYEDFKIELISHTKDNYIFICNEDIICGYGMLRGWTEGYDNPSLGILIDINERGKGLANILMTELHRIGKERNVKCIILSVLRDNYKAIKLYERLGYKLVDLNHQSLRGFKDL